MGLTDDMGFAPVLEALTTMQSHEDRMRKSQAHEFLEKFQKSVRSILSVAVERMNLLGTDRCLP